jgi:hypothetical protein
MSSSASTFSSAGAKSVMSNDMKELTEGKEEITNVIRGHKANLSNPSMLAVLFPFCFVSMHAQQQQYANRGGHDRYQRGVQAAQRASPARSRRQRHPGGDAQQAD